MGIKLKVTNEAHSQVLGAGRIMASLHVFIPGTCESYITQLEGIEVSGGIKVANQPILIVPWVITLGWA